MSKFGCVYSESFKKAVVGRVVSGELSAYKARKVYGIGGKMTVKAWISIYGSEEYKVRKINMLRRKQVGINPRKPKNMEEALLLIEFYEELISVADATYDTDIKKNCGHAQLKSLPAEA